VASVTHALSTVSWPSPSSTNPEMILAQSGCPSRTASSYGVLPHLSVAWASPWSWLHRYLLSHACGCSFVCLFVCLFVRLCLKMTHKIEYAQLQQSQWFAMTSRRSTIRLWGNEAVQSAPYVLHCGSVPVARGQVKSGSEIVVALSQRKSRRHEPGWLVGWLLTSLLGEAFSATTIQSLKP
jgi:hypothetical protein